jgi:two-component system, cell cycle sensor histidine kinase and response regulator CckA
MEIKGIVPPKVGCLRACRNARRSSYSLTEGTMNRRIEALTDELQAIALWDKDYQHRENPAPVETLSWKARRQRATEIQRELRQLEAAPLSSPAKAARSDSVKHPSEEGGCPKQKMKPSKHSALQGSLPNPVNCEVAHHCQLAMAVEQAGESIVITDADGLITYVNPAFQCVTGYTLDELLGQHPRILKSGAHNQSFYKAMWATMKSGETWRGRFINKRKDGTLYHEEASISPVIDETGRVGGYVAVKRDITRETDLEQQFHAAQRMESVGQLASGIAHDFNNLLAAILGNVELLEETIGKNETAQKQLTVVRQAATRATTLTRQLLAFSRRQVLQPQVINVNDVITETVTMLGRVLGDNIRVITQLESKLERVHADAGQLQQTILNLAVNARDAMPKGGTLTIETANVALTEEYRGRHDVVQPGEYVLLSVTDSGTGMTPQVQDRIFEPFYTTKPKGQGTGLGLATVYGIVKQSGGYIWLYSEMGKGTIFKIYFPRTDRSSRPQESIEGPKVTKPSAKLTGTVLLVEDDPIVRELVRAFLEETGLTVLEASSAEDALLRTFRPGFQPRLLVTDHVLPGKDGVSLALELLACFPALRIILMSGYTEHGLPDPQSLDGAEFLTKPFSRHELQERVASLLQG